MIALKDPVSIQPIVKAVARARDWWFSELRDAMPPALLKLLLRPRTELVIRISGEEIAIDRIGGESVQSVGRAALAIGPDDARLNKALAEIGRNSPPKVVVCLDAHMVLRRSIALPESAEANLRKVVALDLDRQTPLRGDCSAFDVIVRERIPEMKKILVDLAVVRRESLHAALAVGTRFGLQPNAVSVASTTRPAGEFNFLRDVKRTSPWRLGEHRLAVLAIALAVLIVINIGLAFWRLETRVSLLATELAAVQGEARVAEKLRTDLRRHESEAQLLAGAGEQAGALGILNAMTQILPDNVWLSRFDLGDASGRIVGIGPSAADVIGRLEKSTMFFNPHFEAAVTRGSSGGGERFDIGFDLRRPSGK